MSDTYRGISGLKVHHKGSVIEEQQVYSVNYYCLKSFKGKKEFCIEIQKGLGDIKENTYLSKGEKFKA
jgi:hypothetical protein